MILMLVLVFRAQRTAVIISVLPARFCAESGFITGLGQMAMPRRVRTYRSFTAAVLLVAGAEAQQAEV
jgi:hypothetical protein